MLRMRVLALVIAVSASTGALTVVAAPSASAVDPLAVVVPGPFFYFPHPMVGVPYSYQIQVTGGVAPYSFELVEGQNHMATYHLSLSSSGVISGTPVFPSAPDNIHGFLINVRVTDSAGPPSSVVQRLDVRIDPLPFRITTPSLPTGAVGEPYRAVLSAAGGTAPFKFTKGGKFPTGLRINRAGVISGTPKRGGTYPVTVNVTDARSVEQSTTRSYWLVITGTPQKPPGGGGGAARPVFAATGDVVCIGATKMKAAIAGFSPSKLYASTIFKGKLSCTGSTGDPAVRIVGAKVSGRFQHDGACVVRGVHNNAFPSRTSFSEFIVSWTAKGGIVKPTTVRYSNHEGSLFGWQLPATAPAGTSTVTGSYAGSDTSTAFIASPGVGAMESRCGAGKQKTTLPASFTLTF